METSYHIQRLTQNGHRPKCKTVTTKLLEEKTGENLHDLGLMKDFLEMNPLKNDVRFHQN